MGIFDFLRGSRKNGQGHPAAPAPADSLRAMKADILRQNPRPVSVSGEPSNWHYEFAHIALRKQVFGNAEQFLPMLRDPDQAINAIGMLMGRVAQAVGLTSQQYVVLASHIDVLPQRFAGQDGFVVKMPPPERRTECHFVAIVPRPQGEARYFTLERAGREATMLCEWREDGAGERHLNLGDGPAPTLGAFVGAVTARL